MLVSELLDRRTRYDDKGLPRYAAFDYILKNKLMGSAARP